MLNYDCTLEITHCWLFCFTNIYATASPNNEWSVLRAYGRLLRRFVKCRVVWTSWNAIASSSNSRALLCANTIRYASKPCECSSPLLPHVHCFAPTQSVMPLNHVNVPPLFYCHFHSWTNHTYTHACMASFPQYHIIILHGCIVPSYYRFAQTNGKHNQMDSILPTGNKCVANGC